MRACEAGESTPSNNLLHRFNQRLVRGRKGFPRSARPVLFFLFHFGILFPLFPNHQNNVSRFCGFFSCLLSGRMKTIIISVFYTRVCVFHTVLHSNGQVRDHTVARGQNGVSRPRCRDDPISGRRRIRMRAVAYLEFFRPGYTFFLCPLPLPVFC